MTPENKTPRRSPFRRPMSPMWFGAVLFGVLLLVQAVFAILRQGQTLDYSQFKSLLAQGQLVEVKLSRDSVQGTYLEGDGTQKTFSTVRVEDPSLAEQLDAKKVRYAGEVQSEWLTELLSWIFPLLLVIGL